MSTTDSPARSRAPWWFNLAGQLLEPWMRIRRDPAEPAALLQAGVPVCYVIERDGLSGALILGPPLPGARPPLALAAAVGYAPQALGVCAGPPRRLAVRPQPQALAHRTL